MICVGDVSIPVPVFLAPMSGVTDAPFRRQASKFGVPVVVTEMIAGSELAAERKDVVLRIQKSEQTGPFVVQLAGRDKYWMQRASEIATEKGADIIDINMGCPSRLVTGGQSGSALMKDLKLARELIIATRQGTDRPVTLKMRLGWDYETLNSPELARIAEGEGVSMITVHGRTRCQFYEGKANWRLVRPVKDAVKVPVIVNGDIESVESSCCARNQSGADGVMAGRSMVGRPWLLAQIAANFHNKTLREPKWTTKIESLCEQLDDSLALYGERLGIKVVRKHISAFVEHAYAGLLSEAQIKVTKKQLCTELDPNRLSNALRQLVVPSSEERVQEMVES